MSWLPELLAGEGSIVTLLLLPTTAGVVAWRRRLFVCIPPSAAGGVLTAPFGLRTGLHGVLLVSLCLCLGGGVVGLEIGGCMLSSLTFFLDLAAFAMFRRIL